MEAYCVKCRQKREMKNERTETTDKGRRVAKGQCPVCGTNMTRFLPAK